MSFKGYYKYTLYIKNKNDKILDFNFDSLEKAKREALTWWYFSNALGFKKVILFDNKKKDFINYLLW